MATAAFYLTIILVANALISFFVAAFWQLKIMFAIYQISPRKNAKYFSTDYDARNTTHSNFFRLLSGEIFPDLRRKWVKAISYLVLSYLVVFVFLALMKALAPEAVSWSCKEPAILSWRGVSCPN